MLREMKAVPHEGKGEARGRKRSKEEHRTEEKTKRPTINIFNRDDFLSWRKK